jgi:hypothetical protein
MRQVCDILKEINYQKHDDFRKEASLRGIKVQKINRKIQDNPERLLKIEKMKNAILKKANKNYYGTSN